MASLLEPVPPDCAAALAALRQASKSLMSSRIPGLDDQSRYTLRYDAARKACDAVLRAEGRRIRAGKGSHKEYIRQTRALLGNQHASLLAQLEVARTVRNDVQCQTREVTELELQALLDAAERLLQVVEAHVDGRCR